MSKRMLCCYYPTTVVFVDDHYKFLNTMRLIANSHIIIPKLFDNPFKVIQFFKEIYQFNPFTQYCVLWPEEDLRDHRNLDVNIPAIHSQLYNPNRFNEVSVLVVDYAMPGINGIELCQQLKDFPFKKILLTGKVDERLAIEAFNQGLIHQFLRKDEDDFSEKLNAAIYHLQQEYFFELSNIILNSIAHHPLSASALSDPTFIKLFDQFFNKKQFTEYYLVDALGSFIFVDFEGNTSWLAVKNEDEMNSDAYIAEVSDEPVAAAILDPLKNKQKLLFLFTDHDWNKGPSEWLSHLYPAQQLRGRENYYYSWITQTTLHTRNILSYKDYLNQLEVA